MRDEQAIQNKIRLKIAKFGTFFRVNVGQSWVGSKVQRFSAPQTMNVNAGDILLREGRPFKTGLATGTSDILGMTRVTVTPDMVGQTVAVFTAIEVKAVGGKPTEAQEQFINHINTAGGFAGIASTEEEALEIIRQ